MDDFLEALFILQSRFFMVPIESQKILENMLVPYADLINHSNEPNATYEYSEEEGRLGVIIRATADISAGQEVTIAYGPDKSNEVLLKQYGFITDSAYFSGENLKLKLRLSNDDPLLAKKMEALSETQVSFRDLKKGDSKVSWKMCKSNADCTLRLNSRDGTFPSFEELSVLRIALFDDTDKPELLDKAIASFKETGTTIAIDRESEIRVMNELEKMGQR